MSDSPRHRMRRLRRTPALRAMRRETRLTPDNLIYPLFIDELKERAGPISSMPGVQRHTLDTLASEIEQVAAVGLRSVLLFGIPAEKDARGSGAFAEDGVIPKAIRRIREVNEEVVVIADVCLCEYTDHGHCGIPREETIDNDATLELIAKAAVAYAQAGAHLVAPSGMMDGMVGAIRSALDGRDCRDVGILSYAVKYASSFYGPFRDAADCAPKFGDRKTYQMDPANVREALAEARLDVEEGADMLMVKPALPYLDVIQRVRDAFPEMPLAAYQVSGEYSMIQAAAQQGWLDLRAVALESLISIKRAGADMIISYFAKDAARWLRG
ncbi:MAG: porphobilinogen synthase [Planctomycetes bacterium]|nr:porphobilinogen synthase [Planctomycetota bacterium]